MQENQLLLPCYEQVVPPCHSERSRVILSAAKNRPVAFETSGWPAILRCAQNNTAAAVCNGKRYEEKSI